MLPRDTNHTSKEDEPVTKFTTLFLSCSVSGNTFILEKVEEKDIIVRLFNLRDETRMKLMIFE